MVRCRAVPLCVVFTLGMGPAKEVGGCLIAWLVWRARLGEEKAGVECHVSIVIV